MSDDRRSTPEDDRQPTPEIDGDRWYVLHRSQVEAEATWITNRTNWLLNANAFMVTSMAIVSTANPATRPPMAVAIWACLPVLGLVVNLGAIRMIRDAESVTQAVVNRYRKGPARDLDPDAELAWTCLRGRLPDLVGAPDQHERGVRIPIRFAHAFCAMWIVLGGVGVAMAVAWAG